MKKKYCVVGLGSRSSMFYKSIVKTYNDVSQVVGFCDSNQVRMDYANKILAELGAEQVPTYKDYDFELMIKETKPDTVIVTSIDRTHHKYIIKAMELGCDVITEKPMTIDEEKCQDILDAQRRTGKNVRVSFNYRYAPHNTKIRELIADDTIGQVNSIHFEWLLNTKHGADYFRRWHRDKRNSGGLLVHKSTHHFDLVNFWIDSQPDTVFAMGDLMFYGKENAEARGVKEFYYRSHGSEAAANDPFGLQLSESDNLNELYLKAEHEDGYLRDQSVFGDGINIEDTLGLMVRYKNKTILTYSLNAYLPWEGFRVVFNGTKGRIEINVVEKVYVNGQGNQSAEGAVIGKEIVVYPMFGESYKVDIVEGKGGHGGGDPVLLADLFAPNPPEDKFKRAATHFDGAMSILTGIAGNKSIATGLPIKVDNLVQF